MTDREDANFEHPCIGPFVPIICDAFDENVARSYLRIIWSGPQDAEHIDNNDAVIQRIVGSVELRAILDANPRPSLLPVVRLGILALEEVPPGTAAGYDEISLFEHDHLEDYEWMWLHQPTLMAQSSTVVDSVDAVSHVDIDLRVKRKVGRQDAVALYASFISPTAEDVGDPPNNSVYIFPMLRVLHSVK